MLNALELDKITKFYGSYSAVRGVSLSIRRGEVFGLLGPNGAGKTTLLKIAAGLIRPTQGKVFVFGCSFSDRNPEVASKVGIVLDQPTTRGIGHLNARQYLRFFSGLYGVRGSSERIGELLSTFGLQDSDKPVANYSRGMLQKLSIIRAMLHSPQLLLLDEPTSGLDPQTAMQLRNILRELSKDGITILLSSHLLWDVERTCNRVAIISQGKLVYQGVLDEKYRSKKVEIQVRLKNASQRAGLFEELSLLQGEIDLRRMRNGRKNCFLLTSSNSSSAENLVQRLSEKGVEILSYKTSSPGLEEIFSSAVSSSPERPVGLTTHGLQEATETKEGRAGNQSDLRAAGKREEV